MVARVTTVHDLPHASCALLQTAASVLLSVARALGNLPERPRRPLIFAALDAEELDALGSKAYAQCFTDQGMTPLVINPDGAASIHTPTDVSERVEHEAMRMVGVLLLATIWQLAW